MPIAELFNNILGAIDRLFTTPIDTWTWGQWLFALILLSLVMSLFGCLCRQRRRGYSRRAAAVAIGDSEDPKTSSRVVAYDHDVAGAAIDTENANSNGATKYRADIV